jgi:hypothetical protein
MAGKSKSRYSGTTAGAKRSVVLGQKSPAEVFTSMTSVLTCAFASCSTYAITDASVSPASRGAAQTARPFSVGAAAAAPSRPRATANVRGTMIFGKDIHDSFAKPTLSEPGT